MKHVLIGFALGFPLGAAALLAFALMSECGRQSRAEEMNPAPGGSPATQEQP